MRQNVDKAKYVRVERELVQEVATFLTALGQEFFKVRNAEGAFDCFKYAVNLFPQMHGAVYSLGHVYLVKKQLEGAQRMFREAARMNPCPLYWQSQALVERLLGNFQTATELLTSTEAVSPGPEVWSHWTMLAADQGHLEEALDWNQKVLDEHPADAQHLLNKALINMTFGQWEENWAQYEDSLSYQPGNSRMAGYLKKDAWDGRPMPGKTLVVRSDQGFGDAMQFARFLRAAKELGQFEKLIYVVRPEQASLLTRVDGVDQTVAFGEKVQFDAFSSLLGILRILKVTPETCGAFGNTLTVDPRRKEVWDGRLDSTCNTPALRVGVVWAGDPVHGNDHARSIKAQELLDPLVALKEKVELFSFQVGATSVLTQYPSVMDLGSEFRDWDDTAAALTCMDVLVSVDTSTAHAAGCLGVPTVLLVPNPPEWRWLLRDSYTNWYDNHIVLRQTTPRDWAPVVNKVAQILQDLDYTTRGSEMVASIREGIK